MTKGKPCCDFVYDEILHPTKQQQIDSVMAFPIDIKLCLPILSTALLLLITTHRLSTSMSPFHICVVANLPPSSAGLLLYKGYPLFPVTVMDTNARGDRSDHFPSITHGEFGFSVPQEEASPCKLFDSDPTALFILCPPVLFLF
ncbi:unnamed protein product [Onchocerca ochengi]|uniref:Secreted protein n=1 Tax=Onchocerca ochengi TaxID=42157 RepID=A0A182E1F7_ONCOC|nr:unnamed protein product [Onchocerca ochengi]